MYWNGRQGAVLVVGADRERVAIEGDAAAEQVTHPRVGCLEVGLEAPLAGVRRADIDVDGAADPGGVVVDVFDGTWSKKCIKNSKKCTRKKTKSFSTEMETKKKRTQLTTDAQW